MDAPARDYRLKSHHMAVRRVVVVGGGGAGDAAAFALRKRGFDGKVTLISSDHDRPYDRPYLSKEFLRGEVELSKVFLHDDAEYATQELELQLNRRETGGSLRDGNRPCAGRYSARRDCCWSAPGSPPPRSRRPPGTWAKRS